ncbi:MAG TPA: hypothetical protein VF763_03470 [Candidatus Limnocylindrales bacterium]
MSPEPHEVAAAARHRHRIARGRLAAVSVRAAMAAGAWVGFALGLVLGAVSGVFVAWFAGALLDWQRELGLTLGVARNLLPFGDQVGLLRTLSGSWWAVIPAAAVVGGLLAAILAALVGGLVAAAYNRTPRHATVLVELPEHEPDHRLDHEQEHRPEHDTGHRPAHEPGHPGDRSAGEQTVEPTAEPTVVRSRPRSP